MARFAPRARAGPLPRPVPVAFAWVNSTPKVGRGYASLANRRRRGRCLHGAACHGCLLIAETSCEMRNVFVDRTLIVDTMADNHPKSVTSTSSRMRDEIACNP